MRNVTALGLVSLFTDFSTEMVLGVLPFFIISSLGASRAILGAIEGSSELTSYAFRMVSGSLSDKIGKRKIFVIAGYSLSTITKPFFAASSSSIDAFLVRFGDRVEKGLRTAPRDALIADSVQDSRSGRAFGVHRTIDQIGAILGPIAALFTASIHRHKINISNFIDTRWHSTPHSSIFCKRGGNKEIHSSKDNYPFKY